MLIAKPALIVADEPFSRLDIKNKFEMANLMKKEQSNRNLSYIIASHDLQTSAYLCDRIIILQKKDNDSPAKIANIAIKSDFMWNAEYSSSNKYVNDIVRQLNTESDRLRNWLTR